MTMDERITTAREIVTRSLRAARQAQTDCRDGYLMTAADGPLAELVAMLAQVDAHLSLAEPWLVETFPDCVQSCARRTVGRVCTDSGQGY